MTLKKPDYITMTIAVQNAEEDCYELHEHGALGSEALSETELRCFFNEDPLQIEVIEALCRSRGWKIISKEFCPDKNWVQECAEVWQPLVVEEISIHPLLNQSDIPPHEDKTILIVPGEGFGTGHHPSTRLAMGFLQKVRREMCPLITKALDFGTGNGILAITTSILWPEAKIEAIDNDPSAIANAQENLELNLKAEKIHLTVDSIENITNIYDLITANIYAEVLCNFHQDFINRLLPGGLLILAGIMRSRAHLIREKFSDQHWQLIENRQESDWDAFLFKKIA